MHIQRKKWSNAYHLALDLLGLFEILKSPLTAIMEIQFVAFTSGIANSETLKGALASLAHATDIQARMCNPKSKVVEVYKTLAKNPKAHPNYLINHKKL